jgi:uncharacterized membrane protein YdjX (TVP38/TMEM64 family)
MVQVTPEPADRQPPRTDPGTFSVGESAGRQARRRLWKFGLLIALLVGLGLLWWLRDHLNLAAIAEEEAELRQLQSRYPATTFCLMFAAFVIVTGLSLPVATGMSMLCGWFLGFGPGLLLVSFASTAGATIAMLICRFFFRDLIQRRFADRLGGINRSLHRDGAFYLLSLRLMPALPYFMLNALMGLTTIRIWSYWWATQLGMLPTSTIYVYAGSQVPSLPQLMQEGPAALFASGQLTRLLIALAVMACLPLVLRWLWLRRQGRLSKG